MAVSSVGTQASPESAALFMAGYNEMLRRLQPAQIIFYGKVPAGCEGNIFHVTAFQEKLKARVKGKKEPCNVRDGVPDD